MRPPLMMLAFALVAALGTSCGGKSPSGSDDDDLGGTTSIPLNQVGNQIPTGQINFAGASYDVGSALAVTANQNGLVTLRLTADLSNAPALQTKVNAMATSLAGVGGWAAGFLSGGAIDMSFKLRVTSEGIQDYFNADKRQQTLVRYDARVGDTYRLTLSNGTTVTRTVTGVSTQDDFPYGLMLIKTITVEQPSHIAGVTKFVYRANHRFGLVWVQAQLTDGTTLSYYLFPQNY